MGFSKKTIRDVDLKGKRVVMRVDFNVPIKEGKVTDDTRIKAALPSIQHIINQGASLVLMSHLGRPKGEGFESKYSLSPVSQRLSELLNKEVHMASDCIGESVVALAQSLKPGDVMLCENTRFHKAEDMKAKTDEDKKTQADFAQELSKLGEVYVNDAFGAAHRAHGSTAIICKYIPVSVAGFLMEKEIQYLDQAVESPEHPFIAIIGGAKVSDKLTVLKSLISKCDSILIGGGMAYTFLKAKGHSIGKSLCEVDLIETAKEILAEAEKKGVKFLLPLDNMAADEFKNDAQIKTVANDIPDNWMALDIGPQTVQSYAAEIAKAKTILWNGPMGCFEMPNFAKGTMDICKHVAESKSVSIVGGGDSVAAVNQSGLSAKFTHISTGGGASLELLEGKKLPGIVALNDK
ncbi:MAG: phosphoglycerate kinase [Desulfobacterales bacterium]|nr:phosphoglycerate kinase [Desulfobacterales bacterium]